MPVSRSSRRASSRKRSRRRGYAHPSPTPRTERVAGWRKRVGWPLAIAGLLLFIVGNVGARTGIVLLPFDPHHLLAQFGGAVVGVLGAIWATKR